MKRTFLFQILTMLMFLSAYSHDIEVANADGVTIYYNYNDDGKELSVTRKANNYNSYSGKVVIPETITYNGQTYPVTSIGELAFRGCTGLTSVIIGKGITSIGLEAFEDCSLTSIEIPHNVTKIDRLAFNNCTGLTSVIIGNGVTSIGNGAFYGCTGLTSVIFGNGVKSIGNGAFSNCIGLTSVEIPNCVTSIEKDAFEGCTGLTSIEIPNSVTSLSGFSGCTNLTSIEIPNSVTSIGERAFTGCNKLASIEIPNSVTSIGYQAFYNCRGLTSIEIPNSVTSIGSYAFWYCSGLTSIEIPNSVTSIGEGAFEGCTGLTSVYIPNSVTSIGERTFRYCSGLTSVEIPNSVTSIGEGAFSSCKGLTSIDIPNSVTSIGEVAFGNCNNINTITLSSNIMSIGNQAFPSHKTTNVIIEDLSSWITFDLSTWKGNPLNNCEECCFIHNGTEIRELIIPEGVQSISSGVFYNGKNITSVTIPQSVTSIGQSAFYGCSGLTSIDIPNSVRKIGGSAFWKCTGLKSFTIHNNRPPIAENNITSQDVYDNCVLYVPAGSENTYFASTNWNKFYNIVAITDENTYTEIVYSPFIEDNKVWKVGQVMTDKESGVQIVSDLYFDGDTIVNGHTAKRMRRDRVAAKEWESQNIEREYVGAWYEKDKKVYCLNVGNNDFELAYDFSLNVGDTINLYDYMVYGDNGIMGVVTKRATGGLYGFKGNYLDIEASWEDKYWSEEDMMEIPVVYKQRNQWLEGVGSDYPTLNPPFISFKSPFTTGGIGDVLMSCSIDDEVIYFNDEYEDKTTPEGEAKKRRFDFSHTIKTQPKSPERRGEEVALSGEYNDRVLDVKLDRLNELYEVQITNNKTSEVTYSKTINAKNIVALNINISAYPKGQYAIAIENSNETFNGVFDTSTTGIAEIVNGKSSNDKSIFNLQGQRISELQKGLNIVDGKKIFVR